ncbi:MAG: hypothetical protein LBF25_00830, partial [Puniceicoccales bacterium]|nr:hypothetical protein [Puniceicoccales bacterium]
MEIQIEEVNAQPESGGCFSSVWGLPGRALGWCGRALGFGGNPIDMAPTDYPEIQARDLDERESTRAVPQDFIDAFRGTGTWQDFATSGIVEARLCQLAANTSDPVACVEWMAEKFRCALFRNGNFVGEVIRLFKGGELTAGGAAAAVKFYLSRARTFLALSNLSNRAQFLYFAIQLASLLPDPKQGAMEAMNAYFEASMAY